MGVTEHSLHFQQRSPGIAHQLGRRVTGIMYPHFLRQFREAL